MDYKKSKAPRTTETQDMNELIELVNDNIYETIVVLSKRANQIGGEMKEELLSKLDEFATQQDNLEEIFENREQIEVSKFYERLPKPHMIALQELKDGGTYMRKNTEE